jgi:L,D-peptidoglycan transpeptidase YkuD (ErfK/YbiS/YcfS/YnhG family)
MLGSADSTRQLTMILVALLVALLWVPTESGAINSSKSSDVLDAGQRLTVGESLTSTNDQYQLSLRTNGDLVLLDANYDVLWQNGVRSTVSSTAVRLRPDGDLVETGADGRVEWSSDTTTTSSCRLILEGDGSLVLRTPARVLWNSHTAATTAMPEGLRSEAHVSQLVVITSTSPNSSFAWLTTWQLSGGTWRRVFLTMAARDGRNGWLPRLKRREGDNTTPEGVFAIGPVMYGNDPNPGVTYQYHRIVPGDYWDENPATGARYNTFRHSSATDCADDPFGGDSECLWLEKSYYPYFTFITFNSPPRGAYGSAIFLHATVGPTTGCVSVDRPDLKRILTWLKPKDHPLIVLAGPSPLRTM